MLIAAILTLLFIGTAAAATDHYNTTTPTADPTASPSAKPTPVPTPAPRQVFSTPKWDTDHVTITVNNAGDPIVVTAWIDSPSKKATISVGANETMVISTPSINAQNGQIVKFGFEAMQNNTVIDTYSATITVNVGPTPTVLPPETVSIAGSVVDASNGTPIVGASVTFESVTYGKTYPAVSTGSDGTFVSPKMYSDYYRITVSAAEYRSVRSTTSDKVTADSTISTIPLTKQAGAATPTPAPTSTPSPTSPIDPWISLLYNPALCVGTISSMIAVIAGSIGIYEWMQRKRRDREAMGGGKKDEPPTGDTKKP